MNGWLPVIRSRQPSYGFAAWPILKRKGPWTAAAKQLDQSCGARVSRLMMRDQGFQWKQKFFPQLGELQWRIEVREYDCAPATSPEIFRIPAR